MEQRIIQTVFGTTETGETATLFRIPNHTDDYIEITNYGCMTKSIHIHDRRGELRNVLRGCETLEDCRQRERGTVYDGLSPALSARLAHKLWETKEVGENYVFFSCQVSEAESGLDTALTFGARIMWVNLNRIVMDLFAAPEKECRMAPGCHLAFQLTERDDYILRTFCPQMISGDKTVPAENTAYADMAFVPLKTGPQIFRSPQESMKPMAELASGATGLAVSSYGDMDSLICEKSPDGSVSIEQSMLRGVQLKSGESFSGRVIYGFDRLYAEEELKNPAPSPFSAFL